MPKIQTNDVGTIRTFKKVQTNDIGVLRNFKKIQTNDSGTIRTIFNSAVEFSYTGEYIFVTKDSNAGYAILITSGTFYFTVNAPSTVDLFLVGQGGVLYGGYCYKVLGVTLPTNFTTNIPNAGIDYNQTTVYTYSSASGTRASVQEKSTITDFWGRRLASGAGADSDVTYSGGYFGWYSGGGGSLTNGGVGGDGIAGGNGGNIYMGKTVTPGYGGHAEPYSYGGGGGGWPGGAGGFGAGDNGENGSGAGGAVIIRWGNSEL